MNVTNQQLAICHKYNVEALFPLPKDKIGIALSTIGKIPINGVRYLNEHGTSGWYIWCGEELSNEVDFFQPLHIDHLEKYLPLVQNI